MLFRFRHKNCFLLGTCLVSIAVIIIITNIHKAINYDYSLTTRLNFTPHFKTLSSRPNRDLFGLNIVLPKPFCPAKESFDDLQEAVDYLETKVGPQLQPENVLSLADLVDVSSSAEMTILDKFNLAIKQTELYSNDSKHVGQLLYEMSTRKIVQVDEKSGGTQLKLKIIYDNGMRAIAKPMRFPREQETLPNQIQYSEYERAGAEIGAFHLDRILGFRRTMPVIGRVLNMTSEIYNLAPQSLRDTFYKSPYPDNNLCFYGTCTQYCDKDHPTCGQNDLLEVALISYMPFYLDVDVEEVVSPWRKSYARHRKAIWELDPKYCNKVKKLKEYRTGRRLLDLMDLAIFDFLTGNKDRHDYAYFEAFGENTFFVNYDNGRGFGRAYYDDMLNIAPLSQCCIIRSSTLKTLLSFQSGPKPLSQLMRESMASDPIAPVLWEPHLTALDRRVNIVLNIARECIAINSIDDVIYPRDNFGENVIFSESSDSSESK